MPNTVVVRVTGVDVAAGGAAARSRAINSIGAKLRLSR